MAFFIFTKHLLEPLLLYQLVTRLIDRDSKY